MGRRMLLSCAGSLGLLLARLAAGQAAPAQPGVEEPAAAATQPVGGYLTGDWLGARTRLADHGITIEPKLTLDIGKNLQGGRDTEGWGLVPLFTLNVTIDTDKLLHWRGGQFFASFQDVHGQSPSDEAGDFQNVSSIAVPGSRTQLSEIWYRQSLLDDKLAVKAGKIDVVGDFAFADHAVEFCNSAMAYAFSSLTMPTYPDPAFGADVFVHPAGGFYVGAGIFDGALAEGYLTGELGPKTLFGPPPDLYLIGEAGIVWTLFHSQLPGRVRVGGWYNTGDLRPFSGGDHDGAGGPYLVIDQLLWRSHPQRKDDDRGIAAFLIFDAVGSEVFPIDRHASGGLTWKGLVPGRDADIAGLGLTYVHFSDDRRAGFVDDAETTFEAFYRIQIKPSVSIKPDLQYIDHPGGQGLPSALVGMVRVEVTF